MNETFDPTKPVQRKNGLKARIISTDLKNPHYPIVAAVTGLDGVETVQSYTAEGRWRREHETHLDLINIKERVTRKVWVNVYPGCMTAYSTKGNAMGAATGDCIARAVEADITYMPGEGL